MRLWRMQDGRTRVSVRERMEQCLRSMSCLFQSFWRFLLDLHWLRQAKRCVVALLLVLFLTTRHSMPVDATTRSSMGMLSQTTDIPQLTLMTPQEPLVLPEEDGMDESESESVMTTSAINTRRTRRPTKLLTVSGTVLLAAAGGLMVGRFLLDESMVATQLANQIPNPKKAFSGPDAKVSWSDRKSDGTPGQIQSVHNAFDKVRKLEQEFDAKLEFAQSLVSEINGTVLQSSEAVAASAKMMGLNETAKADPELSSTTLDETDGNAKGDELARRKVQNILAQIDEAEKNAVTWKQEREEFGEYLSSTKTEDVRDDSSVVLPPPVEETEFAGWLNGTAEAEELDDDLLAAFPEKSSTTASEKETASDVKETTETVSDGSAGAEIFFADSKVADETTKDVVIDEVLDEPNTISVTEAQVLDASTVKEVEIAPSPTEKEISGASSVSTNDTTEDTVVTPEQESSSTIPSVSQDSLVEASESNKVGGEEPAEIEPTEEKAPTIADEMEKIDLEVEARIAEMVKTESKVDEPESAPTSLAFDTVAPNEEEVTPKSNVDETDMDEVQQVTDEDETEETVETTLSEADTMESPLDIDSTDVENDADEDAPSEPALTTNEVGEVSLPEFLAETKQSQQEEMLPEEQLLEAEDEFESVEESEDEPKRSFKFFSWANRNIRVPKPTEEDGQVSDSDVPDNDSSLRIPVPSTAALGLQRSRNVTEITEKEKKEQDYLSFRNAIAYNNDPLRQPKSVDEDELLRRKYAAISDPGERAYQILVDLGMVSSFTKSNEDDE